MRKDDESPTTFWDEYGTRRRPKRPRRFVPSTFREIVLLNNEYERGAWWSRNRNLVLGIGIGFVVGLNFAAWQFSKAWS